MGPPKDFPERRKEHALRSLYNRVEALEKLQAEQDKVLAVLEEKAVTKGWLFMGVLSVALATVAGTRSFAQSVEESAAKHSAKLSTKLDDFIGAQSATNIKTEAMYLNSIERRPREEVREAVLRNTPPKEK